LALSVWHVTFGVTGEHATQNAESTASGMRNLIDFTLTPEALFLNPAENAGLHLLKPAEFFWRPLDKALIEGFAASGHEEMNERIRSYLTLTRKHKAFTKAVEFNSVPVLLHEASFRKSYVLANGKCLLNGASGVRLQNRFCWENEEDAKDPDERLIDYFNACQTQNLDRSIPIWNEPLPAGLPCAIECRNTFNYFHFMTESLCQLALLAQGDIPGDIYFHFPNSPEKHRAFAKDFVDALFPELADRVYFERAPKEYDCVLTALNLFCLYYQFPAEVIGSVDSLAPSDAIWKGHTAARASQAVLAMNSVNSSLRVLRDRALHAIEGKDFSHLPKRFFVGRDNTQSRTRDMAGEEELFDMLRHFGFEYVVFEHLSPLEQVAIMANAEMMISYHGAGFTNMLFADPKAYVIELGTLQTAVYRWKDFWPLATVSGCRYVTFIADYNKEDPLENPVFSESSITPVALSEQALGQVMAFVVTLLGKIPHLSRGKDVLGLTRELLAVQAYDRASEVLAIHAGLVPGNVDLCLAKADCHKARAELKSELYALHLAWEADRNRWQTLIRMIWCAKRCDMPNVMSWALTTLRYDFPKRYDTLIKAQPWMLQLT
jgi:hypothetical protein